MRCAQMQNFSMLTEWLLKWHIFCCDARLLDLLWFSRLVCVRHGTVEYFKPHVHIHQEAGLLTTSPLLFLYKTVLPGVGWCPSRAAAFNLTNEHDLLFHRENSEFLAVSAIDNSDKRPLWLFPGPVLSGATSVIGLTSDLDLDVHFASFLPHDSDALLAPGTVASSRTGPRPHRAKPGTPAGHLPCDQCGATFATPRGLKLHRDYMHFNKTPYSCEQCGRGFTMRGHYVGHMNMHNKVKAFKCLRCPKAFAHRSSLRWHMRNSDCGK